MAGKADSARAMGTIGPYLLAIWLGAPAIAAGCQRNQDTRAAPERTVAARPDGGPWQLEPGLPAVESVPIRVLSSRTVDLMPEDGEAPTWTPAKPTASPRRPTGEAWTIAGTAELCIDPNEVAHRCTEAKARRPAGPASPRPPRMADPRAAEAPWHRLGPDLYATDADRELAARIRTAIAPDNTAQAFSQVQVQVRDGVVTLRGTVDSEIDRVSARERAVGVAGPHAVYDLMEFAPFTR
jgi:hypothetical protein